MPDVLSTAAAATGGGFGLAGGIYFFKWLIDRAWGRMDKRDDRIDAATQRLIEGLERRLDEETKSRVAESKRRDKVEIELRSELREVRADLADCKQRHADSEAEVTKLQAMMQGYGDARQRVQVEVAAERKAENGR